MPQNPDYLRQAQLLLYVQWIFFNALGWGIGALLVRFAVDEAQSASALFGLMAFAWGVGQWLVLRNYVGRLHVLWPFVTTAGFVLGQRAAQAMLPSIEAVLGIPLSNAGLGSGIVIGGILGVALGLMVGICQLPILPSNRAPRLIWIVANVTGWGLGLQLGSVVNVILPLGFESTSLMSAILSACISGFWVMQLLNKQG